MLQVQLTIYYFTNSPEIDLGRLGQLLSPPILPVLKYLGYLMYYYRNFLCYFLQATIENNLYFVMGFSLNTYV